MIKKITKNIFTILVLVLAIALVGCQSNDTPNDNEQTEEKKLSIEYDEVIYYGQVGKIKVTSPYEDDEIYIESLNTKVIKIIENSGDNNIALAVGVGEADVFISNYYGEEATITIKVEAKGDFAPPIESMELSIVEEGPYYINQPYHLQIKFTPEVFNDTYRFISSSDDYTINSETNEIVFKRTGKMVVSVFAETNSKRANLEVEVTVNPSVEMYEVLFIGNSLTYVFDIPSIIQDMIEADGVYMCYSEDTPGGSKLASHEAQFDKYIEKYNFTHVILQGQSYEPIDSKQSFLAAAKKLGDKAKAKGAQVIFYESWAYDRETYNGLTRYEMTEKLKLAYEEAADLVGAKISRSGEAFKLFEETYGRTPSLYKDMNHQSYYGAYLSACIHYSTITGKRASDNMYQVEDMDPAWAAKIRQIADIISFGE